MPERRTQVHSQRGRLEHAASAPIRRELYNGRMHTVVPAVLAVEGVMNGALVTADELGKFVEAWNGRPVPILHPQEDGQYISANYPDVLERSPGILFGARVEDRKLKAEFWLDEQKMDDLGQSALLGSMRDGQTVEVSTGYFSDNVIESGDYEGKPYTVRHVNIRPDHVALLPGHVGACSIADGCGAPRVNQTDKGNVRNALTSIMRALGVKPNDCNCEDDPMSKLKALAALILADTAQLPTDAQGIKVNFEIGELEKMSESTLAAISAAIKSLLKKAAMPEEDPEEKAKAEAAKAKANAAAAAAGSEPLTLGKLGAMIESAVTVAVGKALAGEAITGAVRRSETKARILANAACAFTANELDAMALESLDKYEKSIRPADYSGQGGYHPQAGAPNGGSPLMIHAGALAKRPKADDGKQATE